MAQIDLKDAYIYLEDGAANSVLVNLGEGNLTYTEKRNVEYVRDRGRLDTTREGDEDPVEVSLDAMWEEIIPSGSIGDSDNSAYFEDIVKGEVRATGVLVRRGITYTSSDTSDPCAPYAVNIRVVYDPTCNVGGGDVHLNNFRWETFVFDLSAGTVAMTGQCNILEAGRSVVDSTSGS